MGWHPRRPPGLGGGLLARRPVSSDKPRRYPSVVFSNTITLISKNPALSHLHTAPVDLSRLTAIAMASF
ncbi:hypothetical protein BU23DRAFT_560784 [Bimuria novae-zelandiae CBS 107.79]|uniref:Uncharacterized protein n=1 Tax=Bimuria novae-zelandiae CBS 107.79 TaxID=1447943 RepID=A0A6A5UXN5_9PLEO|nr:hypothetical protein BU23DRAFT_560784 [Bimuria novae-zelandiae CBS 107.79]